MKVEQEISNTRIADLLCSALEGGSNYWIVEVTAHPGTVPAKPWGDTYTPSYIEAAFSGSVTITDEDGKQHALNAEALQKGLQIMANDEPNLFSNFVSESDDAATGDVFLQCCLFGKVIYG